MDLSHKRHLHECQLSKSSATKCGTTTKVSNSTVHAHILLLTWIWIQAWLVLVQIRRTGLLLVVSNGYSNALLLAVNVHCKGHWFAGALLGFVSFICISVVIVNLKCTLFYRHIWLGTCSHMKLPAFLFIQDVINTSRFPTHSHYSLDTDLEKLNVYGI